MEAVGLDFATSISKDGVARVPRKGDKERISHRQERAAAVAGVPTSPRSPRVAQRASALATRTVTPRSRRLVCPLCKGQTIVVDSPKIPTRDHHVRSRRICRSIWIMRFVVRDQRAPQRDHDPRAALGPTALPGYSRTIGKVGATGPGGFDYTASSKGPNVRPRAGAFTRFG